MVARTVAAFEEVAPEFFVPMRCTGFSVMAQLERALPSRVIEPSAGTRVIFGASR